MHNSTISIYKNSELIQESKHKTWNNNKINYYIYFVFKQNLTNNRVKIIDFYNNVEITFKTIIYHEYTESTMVTLLDFK